MTSGGGMSNRAIRSRIAANKFRVTAASASWTVTYFVCRVTFVLSISVSNRPTSLVEAACFSGWLALPPTTWRIAGSTHNRSASLTSS